MSLKSRIYLVLVTLFITLSTPAVLAWRNLTVDQSAESVTSVDQHSYQYSWNTSWDNFTSTKYYGGTLFMARDCHTYAEFTFTGS